MKVEKFTEKAREAISEANDLTRQNSNSQIEPIHLLAALLQQEGGVVQKVIQKVGGNWEGAPNAAMREIGLLSHVYGGNEPGISPGLRKVLDAAWQEMNTFHDEYLSVEHLLLALVEANDEPVKRVMRIAGLTRQNTLQALTSIRGSQRVTSQNPEAQYEALEKYGRNLTQLAEAGKLDPVIGRDEEIRRVIQVLSRRTKNNPVLIGDPGVGKTAIVEGLAQRIVRGDVPKTLTDKSVVTSFSTAFRRSSNSPRYLAPATSAPRSSVTTCLSTSVFGTSPRTMRCARPSTMAVLPTPGSPIRTGLFLVRRLKT